MLFHSFPFLFFFLPVVWLGWWVAVRGKMGSAATGWLLAGSLFFYAWWNPTLVLLLLGSLTFNYACGSWLRRIERAGLRTAVLAAGIASNVALLGYFKYAGFLAANWNSLTGSHLTVPDILLPIGISFITFQKIAYLADASKRPCLLPPCGFSRFALFVCFFPQLIAGPIVHYIQLVPQLGSRFFRHPTRFRMAVGTSLFILGMAKKILFADRLAEMADPVFSVYSAGGLVGGPAAWCGLLAFGMQIYMDFSAYSDMALGLAHLFNIRLPDNFALPYQARSVVDFWRRWHITLSHFLRDYIYIPLGGSRHGRFRMAAALLVTMFLGGLWHGASWNFVLWGMAHGTMLAVVHVWRGTKMPRIPAPVAWAATFVLVQLVWVFFRTPDLAAAGLAFRSLAGIGGAETVPPAGDIGFLALVTGIALALPNAQYLCHAGGASPEWCHRWFRKSWRHLRRWWATPVHAALLGLLLLYILEHSKQVDTFIYFQF